MSSDYPPAAWNAEGEPENLTAAAEDALEWLRVFVIRSHSISWLANADRQRLESCCDALWRHLPVAPEAQESPNAPQA